MSDTSQGDGWWQASDGKFYAPEAHPDYKPPPPPPPPPADVDESKPKGLLGKVSAADKPPFLATALGPDHRRDPDRADRHHCSHRHQRR